VQFIETESITRPYVEKANSLTPYYADCLIEVMREQEKVVVLDADLAPDCGLKGAFKEFPERCFQFGISEQDMVSAAGGMALEGLIPIVHSFSAFLCRRANEQIYNNATEATKVIYVGCFSGILPYGIGISHTCMDDIALMKTMPGMTVFEPGLDITEIKIALRWAVHQAEGPVYIRLACLPVLEGMRR
jgi:transketolase